MVTNRNHSGETPSPAARPGDIAPISERQLALLWERRASRSRTLRTDQGARVRVLYPGRPGVTAGPDFRDAVLLVEGAGLVQGDVEVHLRQRDWLAHGHQRDPNYNGVALHVALEPDATSAVTVSGVTPPVVALRALVDAANDDAAAPSDATRCQLWRMLSAHGYRQPQSASEMRTLLNRAGDDRFLSRSRLAADWLAGHPIDQLLWEAICQALGYRHNQHPMLLLAASMPIAALCPAVRRFPSEQRPPALAAWLTAWAGFGTDYRWMERWPPPAGLGLPLETGQWRLFRVRPANHPRRRLLGAAAIVARHCAGGLAAGLYRRALSGRPKELTDALAVPDASDGLTAPIGAGRARDIAVNAVLPNLHAWRLASNDPRGAGALLELYRAYGALPANEITRQMTQSLQPHDWGRPASNARRQQGLLHLQRLLAGQSRPEPI